MAKKVVFCNNVWCGNFNKCKLDKPQIGTEPMEAIDGPLYVPVATETIQGGYQVRNTMIDHEDGIVEVCAQRYK